MVTAAGLGAGQRRRGDRARAVVVSATSSKSLRDLMVLGTALLDPAAPVVRSPAPSRTTDAYRVMARCSSSRGSAGRTGNAGMTVGAGPALSACRAAASPARPPTTRPSSRLLEASRLAPCIPVRATSPAANNPAMSVRPYTSVTHTAAAVVRSRHDRESAGASGRCPPPGRPRVTVGNRWVEVRRSPARRGRRRDRRSRPAARRSRRRRRRAAPGHPSGARRR